MVIVAMMAMVIPALLGAEWMQTEKENLMEGTVSRTAFQVAEISQGTLNDAALAIQQTGDDYDVFIFWGGYRMDRDTYSVTYRIGEEPVSEWLATLSTSDEATFLSEPFEVVTQLILHEGEKLIVQATRSTGVISIARFDLTGVTEAVADLGVE
ncbi:MAG: hypothetical protein ACOCSK_00295 [Rhodothermales bacterium]